MCFSFSAFCQNAVHHDFYTHLANLKQEPLTLVGKRQSAINRHFASLHTKHVVLNFKNKFK
jgi:hypothetical protein